MPKQLKNNNIVNNLNYRDLGYYNYLNPKFTNNQIVKSYFNKSNYLYRYNILFHKSCVNSIRFSDCGQFMVSGGDDLVVLFSDVEKCLLKNYRPQKMKMKHRGNIFTTNLNHDSSKAFSGGNDAQFIIHDTSNGNLVTSRLLETSIYDISIDPFNTNIASIGCEDGNIVLFDLRTNAEPVNLGNNIFNEKSYKSIQYNPVKENLLLITSNCKKDVFLFDLRNNKIIFEYEPPFTEFTKGTASCARYNRNGDKIIVLRNRLPATLYSASNSNALYEFDSYGYYNSITQKNTCFCGDDYIAIPSDDFNIYLFKVPEFIDDKVENTELKFINKPDFVLHGHLSIVNNVAYNYNRSILASSSVENCIKFWSPFNLNSTDENNENDLSINYLDRQICPHSISRSLIVDINSDNESTSSSNENISAINFFDNLIRYDFRDEDNEEFLKNEFNKNRLVDIEFTHNLKYFKALINDFELNGKQFNSFLLDKFKEEKTRIDRQSKYVLTSKSIGFLFNCKKIKQHKLIIERCFKLVQSRLRFLRDIKRSEINNDNDLIEEIKLLKSILIKLNKIYNNKRALEIKLSSTRKELLSRLTKIFFRRSLRRLPLVVSSSSSSSDSTDNESEDANSPNRLRTVHSLSSLSNLDSDISQYLSLSDDESLSAGSVLDESQDEDNKNDNQSENTSNKKRKKTFKTKIERLRKSDHIIDIHLLSSNSETDSNETPIRKMRKSSNKSNKTKNYNFIAFDSEIDCETDTESTSTDNELKPNCSFNISNNNLLKDTNDNKLDNQKQSDEDE